VNKTEPFGIVQNLPFEEYQQLSGLNQSTLKQWFSVTSKKTDAYKNYQALQKLSGIAVWKCRTLPAAGTGNVSGTLCTCSGGFEPAWKNR